MAFIYLKTLLLKQVTNLICMDIYNSNINSYSSVVLEYSTTGL